MVKEEDETLEEMAKYLMELAGKEGSKQHLFRRRRSGGHRDRYETNKIWRIDILKSLKKGGRGESGGKVPGPDGVLER